MILFPNISKVSIYTGFYIFSSRVGLNKF